MDDLQLHAALRRISNGECVLSEELDELRQRHYASKRGAVELTAYGRTRLANLEAKNVADGGAPKPKRAKAEGVSEAGMKIVNSGAGYMPASETPSAFA